MQFDVVVSPQDISSSNLLTNPSFEEGDGTPSSWTTSAWQGADVVFSRDDTTQRTGEWSASIENTAPNDASFEQTVGGLVLGRAYEACAYLKGEAIAGDGAFTGGNVSVVWTDGGGGLQATHSDGGMGTFDFQPACTTFQAETETAVVECRLGHWSSTVTGKLWCDDLTLEPLGSAF
jgi:hypothetical protein